MSLKFSYPQGQLYECRDCVSRCCAMPWRNVVTKGEKERLESKEWIRDRLRDHGALFEESGAGMFVLPMVERNRRVECVFLEKDGFCSVHRQEGHEFLPVSCQLFPFDFLKEPGGKIHLSLSQLCPSIRDSYGNSIESLVESRFHTCGEKARELSTTMDLGHQTVLNFEQYSALVNQWIGILKGTGALKGKLEEIHKGVSFLQEELSDSKEIPPDVWKEVWTKRVGLPTSTEGAVSQKGGMIPKILLALALYRISYPIRVMRSNRFSIQETSARLKAILQLMQSQGEIDLLYTLGKVNLGRVQEVKSNLGSDEIQRRLSEYFIQVLDRRNLFEFKRHLLEVILQMAVAYMTMIRFAKIRAFSRGSREAEGEDYREGISVVEFSLLYHPKQSSDNRWMEIILNATAQNPLTFEKILNAEE